MISALLPGLRNLRVSLLTGALIIGSLYILFGSIIRAHVLLKAEAREIIALAPFMPHLLLAILCVFIGSLYMTYLEGIVDFIHRKTLFVEPTTKHAVPTRILLEAIMPLSIAARGRLYTEIARFYEINNTPNITKPSNLERNKRKFIKNVLSEILWLEGKLVGTPLEVPYDQYRSEGELRLGCAITIPLVSIAGANAIMLSRSWLITVTIVSSLLAIQLAKDGLYYFRRAHSFLAHHIADGSVLTPSMEALLKSKDPLCFPQK